jgi:hypothetical protein
MKRAEYLNRCQRWAVSKDKSCLVSYNGNTYSPYGYILSFKLNGQPEHTAMMKDLKANAIYYGVLSKVEAAK